MKQLDYVEMGGEFSTTSQKSSSAYRVMLGRDELGFVRKSSQGGWIAAYSYRIFSKPEDSLKTRADAGRWLKDKHEELLAKSADTYSEDTTI